jgi:arylformamidase
MIDLTHPLSPRATAPAGTPPVELRQLTSHADDVLQDTWLGASVHAGTHVDAPLHAVPGGEDVAGIGLDRLIGPAVAWRIERREPREIGLDELLAAEPRLRPGDRLLISTGWDRFYGDAERYRVHPHLATDAAEWLVERGVVLLGIDTPTPDLAAPLRPPGFDYPVHRVLLEHGVLIAENLANLARVAGRRFTLLVCPIPIRDSDGAPARIFAQVDA